MSLKYNKKILCTTEYTEALALAIYCEYNSLNFFEQIQKREKATLNQFPDFIIGDTCLEVARTIDIQEGKQQCDVNDVFGKSNALAAVDKKNNELLKYSGTDSHNIEFGIKSNVAYASREIRDCQIIVENIIEKINKKYKRYSNRKESRKIDLFLINYDVLDKKSLEEVIEKYQNSDAASYFNEIYLLFLFDEDTNSRFLLKMNKKSYEFKPIKLKISKNEIVELLFKLQWLKESDYVND